MADVKHMVERRRTTVNMGLPEWGKDLPEDVCTCVVCMCICVSIYMCVWLCVQFLDRLDIFNEERSRKKEELTDKIKREVSLLLLQVGWKAVTLCSINRNLQQHNSALWNIVYRNNSAYQSMAKKNQTIISPQYTERLFSVNYSSYQHSS